ncbi:MAG: DUF465 domain-containing protein [Deltaproteobacteria bacterium]|nr:DUF465 domain-containing protein [Deltaproteobacteria bacterium]MBI4224621.1 DUF465 domain-containing protein [Deltaproteobacteria bacterium]
MERQDVELIQSASRKDKHLAALYQEHLTYERQLSKLDNKLFLTPEEELQRKELQKKKLLGKDKIEDILKRYRGNQSSH